MRSDIILIHAPSLYDFREERRHYGPISDVIPSTPVFDMYPLGFISLVSYLGRRGFRVSILNLAARMLMSPRFDAEKAIRRAEAKIYGIDLHWLVHAHGAVEVARIVKRHHPDAALVVGGLTATIYYREILEKYPWIDYVVLGDTVEEVFRMLADYEVDGRGQLEEIPNLAWREGGRIRTTGLRLVPQSLDEYAIDYGYAFRQAVKSGDPLSFAPFAGFFREPIGAVLAYKGCPYNCATCGGSRYTYARCFGRIGLAFKTPVALAEELMSICDYMRIPVFIVGDVQVLGNRWCERLIGELKSRGFDGTLFLEFFSPPRDEVLRLVERIPGRKYLQISPESQDEDIRRWFGRPYGNHELERFIHRVLEAGFERLDLYFMVGLPGQTPGSALGIPRYVDRLYGTLNPRLKARLDAFVAPLAPFVDPGSPAFEHPEAYGYTLLARSLEDHRALVERAPTWREMLNYETRWMSRRDVAEATYLAAEELVKVKARHGVIEEGEAERVIDLMARARRMDGDKPLHIKETVPRGDLYPSVKLIRSLTPKALSPGLLVALIRAAVSPK